MLANLNIRVREVPVCDRPNRVGLFGGDELSEAEDRFLRVVVGGADRRLADPQPVQPARSAKSGRITSPAPTLGFSISIPSALIRHGFDQVLRRVVRPQPLLSRLSRPSLS